MSLFLLVSTCFCWYLMQVLDVDVVVALQHMRANDAVHTC